jgi:hypothetical protein
MSFWKKNKDALGGLSPSEVVRREAQMRQQKLKQDIARCTLNVATVEATMNRKLRAAVNRALDARATGSETELRNAYIDIRMAIKFLSLTKGMSSVMTRLESNMDFARIADEMADTMKRAGEMTSKNPKIDVFKLDEMYNAAVSPVNRIMEQMEQFNDLTVSQPFNDVNITDAEVERVIKQVIASPKGSIEPPEEVYRAVTQSVSRQEEKPKAATSMDDVLSELNDLARRLS